MKTIHIYVSLVLLVLLSACVKHEYTNSIPLDSKALITVNAMDFASNKSPFSSILTPFVSDDKKELKGIDLTKDIYIFETGEGNIGLCAPLADAYDFNEFVKRLGNLGVLKDLTDIGSNTFCTAGGSWVIGFNDDMMMAMGPVTGADSISEMRNKMANMMEQEEAAGIHNSQLWKHSQQIPSPMKLVAHANALPKEMSHSMMIGTPKGTNPEDVIIEASMDYKDSILYLVGSASSLKPNVHKSIKKVEECYKPITFDWERLMNDTTLVGVFTNVCGKDFVEHLERNKALNNMLMTSNAYDRIRENNGDMALLLTSKCNLSLDGGIAIKDDDVSYKVLNLPKGNRKNGEKFIVVFNLEALKGSAADMAGPLFKKMKRVIYIIK